MVSRRICAIEHGPKATVCEVFVEFFTSKKIDKYCLLKDKRLFLWVKLSLKSPMSSFNSFTGKSVIVLAMAAISTVAALAQSNVNNLVLSEQEGNNVHIYIDHRALDMFGDSVIVSLNSDGDSSWNTWKDVLTNGTSPGMDVNFDGWNAYGVDSLLVDGASKLDSTLEVDGYVRMNDSLYVAMYALFQAKLSVGDSLVVAGNTAFTGSVTGPKATASNEFVTFEQLDSLASVAPFNETYRVYKTTAGTPQTVNAGNTDQLVLAAIGTYTEISDQAAAQVLQQPFSLQNGAQGNGQVISLSDPGVYETQLTLEVDPNAGANPDIYVLVELLNYDASQGNGLPVLRVLAADAAVVHDAATFGGQVPAHFNMSMSFIADNSDEEVYVRVTPTGGDIDIVTFGLSIARKGED